MTLHVRWLTPDDVPLVETALGLPEQDVLRFVERPDTAAVLVDDDAGRLCGALFYRVHFTRHHVHARPLVFAPDAPRKPLLVRLLLQYLLDKFRQLKTVGMTLDVPEDDLPQQLLLREMGLKAAQVLTSADGAVYRFHYGEGVPQQKGVGVEE